MSDSCSRLAVYGTLGPGKPNHHHLAGLSGEWTQGTVRGELRAEGWGAALGFPGLVLDPNGLTVAVDLLESAELHQHWQRLDDFEGTGYRRVLATITTDRGPLAAWIYVLAEDGTA
jgi:gamma-glutamylcyclotransferase (GGCT)/AIG2-like uncharacterized protein YtfP